MDAKERLRINREQKFLKRRKQKMDSYMRNRVIEPREYKNTKVAKKQRSYRKKKSEIRNKEKLRKRKYRQKLKSVMERGSGYESFRQNAFTNRTSRHRAVKKLKSALPHTPLKRTATLATYLQKSSSPTVQNLRDLNLVTTPEEHSDNIVGAAVLNDLKLVIDASKMKRSKDSLQSMNAVLASISGEHVTEKKCKKRLALKLDIPVRRISGGKKIRTKVLRSEESCWLYTQRKTRSDAISEEIKRQVYDYWQKPGISRPTGNKSDVKRERIGPKTYTSHMIQILEKTQTEVYTDFKREHPEIKISQRSFENCRPFFVRPVRQRDRQTCCCRYHLEIKAAFKSCMEFRKKILLQNPNDDEFAKEFPVFRNISEMVDITLCNTEEKFHDMSCLKRECVNCGIQNLNFLPEETDTSDTSLNVKWEKFENVTVQIKGNKTIKKLLLITKETKPGVLFSHLQELLKSFPLHQHRASWQSEQFKSLVSNLPLGSCVCVHDFSENYRCSEMQELQSTYFQKTEVSVHVTVIHRHAMLQYDGVESTQDTPTIITEHFYAISPDQQHDQYFVHEVRKQISEYLKSISYETHTMHEFTDRCPSQYKSRHCFGDISNACSDFGYKIFTRNFFETAHAKGTQDAAGGILKHQADLAVLRGRCRIQNAKDLYDYATENLTKTKSNMCKRRVFKYLESIPRDSDIRFKPIGNIRSIHHVRVEDCNDDDEIFLNELSCFSCDNCLNQMYGQCLNYPKTGPTRTHKMLKETHNLLEKSHENVDENLIAPLKSLVAVGNVIAVFTDDVDFDYFLLLVKKDLHVLDRDFKDSWGATLPSGTEVISGLYYDRKTDPLKYRLIPRKVAVVPAMSVLYICSEIRGTATLELPESLHLDILECTEELKSGF